MCDCDGKRRALRVVTTDGNDPSEQILGGIETATGDHPGGCPWRAYEDPFVGEVLRAYRHWKAKQLSLVWPDGVPLALIRGLEVYDGALNAVQAHDMIEERKKRDEEQRKRSLDQQVAKKRGRR